MASSATHTTQMASSALSSFLQARHARVPSSDVSRALRRKHQRGQQKKKRSRSHAPVDDGGEGERQQEGSVSDVSPGTSKNDRVKTAAISKEERAIRQRILTMRENKRKGKPILPSENIADSDESEDSF
ncbi:hypothetical protein H072_9727 [Dactylellina haptotyla CBS 200.50]|uniref:Uncharacterized protein n=1 Tax=Dactylellina haptotyla (strain CBS 200.50) TaxID=1284197 RepID=S8BNB0_DACHA|nr:hypothetical protein H072_9727 [Dactylellina haptotyla CBS 200.50]